MSTVRTAIVITLLIAAVGSSAAAVQQQSPPGRGTDTPPGGSQHMHGMMGQCQEHHQAMAAALEQALATIREARGSSDPAKLRAALEQVESSLASVQQRVAGCAAMMTRMSNMMNMMMGMMSGSQGAGMMRGGPRGGTGGPATPPER